MSEPAVGTSNRAFSESKLESVILFRYVHFSHFSYDCRLRIEAPVIFEFDLAIRRSQINFCSRPAPDLSPTNITRGEP